MSGVLFTQEVKSKWLKALRSGKFKQGDGVLKSVDVLSYDKENNCTYCCLGVLGEVCNIEGNNDNTFLTRQSSSPSADAIGRSKVQGLPSEVQKKLASMNDGLDGESKHTFSEIADYIQKNVPAVKTVKKPAAAKKKAVAKKKK